MQVVRLLKLLEFEPPGFPCWPTLYNSKSHKKLMEHALYYLFSLLDPQRCSQVCRRISSCLQKKDFFPLLAHSRPQSRTRLLRAITQMARKSQKREIVTARLYTSKIISGWRSWRTVWKNTRFAGTLRDLAKDGLQRCFPRPCATSHGQWLCDADRGASFSKSLFLNRNE